MRRVEATPQRLDIVDLMANPSMREDGEFHLQFVRPPPKVDEGYDGEEQTT